MKLSRRQFFWIFATFEFGMTALLTVTPAIEAAKQDAWISFIVASLAALMITLMALKLSLYYPKQTLVEITQTILGKWAGKIAIIPYLLMWYSVIGIILRQSSDFIAISMFDKTPIYMIALLILFLLIYVTYQGGISGIARCSEIAGPIIYLILITALFLSLSNIHLQPILPIYADSQWLNIVKGSLSPLSFFGESIMVLMLTPFAKDKNITSSVMWGVAIACFTTCISVAIVIMTFGPILGSRIWYPFLLIVRFISIIGFIQNIDVLIVTAWILSTFIKLSLYFFITSYGTAQWLNIKNWRRVIWFVAPISYTFGLIFPNVAVSSMEYPKYYWIPVVLPVNMVGIPLFLLAIRFLRHRLR